MSRPITIIPCLDLDGGRVVKGVKFADLQDAGDPIELARRYLAEGADEITFLDVSASIEGRATLTDTLTALAGELTMPITIGGGIRELDDAARVLGAGATRVSVATAAIARPELLGEISQKFGPDSLVLSIDARRGEGSTPSGYEVTSHGGKQGTGLDVVEWAARAEATGVGSILLNSIDADGTKEGFDLPMLRAVREVITCRLIASGGAGAVAHFTDAARAGADAVLAASVFHFGVVSIADVKDDLESSGFTVTREGGE